MRLNPARRRKGVIALLAAALGFLPFAPGRAEDDAAALARLRKEMAQAIGEATCVNVSFCRVMPVGHDHCGNPTLYLGYNNVPGLKDILETKAAEYGFIEEEQHRGKPKPADCKVVAMPKPSCVNNRCVAGSTSY